MPILANFKVRRGETHSGYRYGLRVISIGPVTLALYSNSDYTDFVLVLVRMSEKTGIWAEVFRNYCRGVLWKALILYSSVAILA